MAMTWAELWGTVRAEVGSYYPAVLAKQHTKAAILDICNRRDWSWLMAVGRLTVPAPVSGTVTVVNGTTQVTADASFTSVLDTQTSLGRRQCQIGTGAGSLYEIRDYTSGSGVLTLSAPVPLADGDYTATVKQLYFLPPPLEGNPSTAQLPVESSNFSRFLRVVDKDNNYALILDKTSAWLDIRDPRRDSTGQPTHLVQFAPTSNRYAGAGNEGNQIRIGTPRFELWPGPDGPHTFDCLYLLRELDLSDDYESYLPETVNPRLFIEGALVLAYRWAISQNVNRSRAYLPLIQLAAQERERLYLEAYTEDDLYYEARIKDTVGGIFPWLMGAAYAQVHDVYLMAGMSDY